jgi:hypothetical protein
MIAVGGRQFYFMTLLQALPTRRTRPRPPRGKALSQPHDALFRWTFSQLRHAVGLLKAALPSKLAAVTAWSTLRLENGSHVDQALRGRHCDLVFSARMHGEPVYFPALEVLLRYLLATHGRFSVKKIGNLLDKAAGPKAREAIVTVLDDIERRGRAQGRAQGRVQGRAQMLLELLTIRFGAVPPEVNARVMAADEATLSRWAARVLTAPTLANVLDEARAGASPVRRPSASKRAR